MIKHDDEEIKYQFYMHDFVSEEILLLIWMHATCFVFMVIGELSKSKTKQSYMYVVLLISTVPIYQFVILKAIFILRKTETLAMAL